LIACKAWPYVLTFRPRKRSFQPQPFLISFAGMNSAPPLRTLLVLGRVANLPTVWSNCLAGWLLGGGGNFWKLPFLFLGAGALYTGGAFLNDAFDAEFDRQRRAERPIPAGKISAQLVWKLGFGQLAAGIFLLVFCSQWSAGAGIFLALFILLYNFSHKFFTASPWLMGGCRFWVYVIAGAAGAYGLNGWPIFCGLALAFYAAGLGYVARRERFRVSVPRWPLLLLVTPVVLAMLMNTGRFRLTALIISIWFLLWMAWCVWRVFAGVGTSIGWMAANLLAGMVLADWLAVAPQIPSFTGAALFLALFGLTKWLQKIVPTT
jgi:4-hydroxybenzoate polyprenyltransferase